MKKIVPHPAFWVLYGVGEEAVSIWLSNLCQYCVIHADKDEALKGEYLSPELWHSSLPNVHLLWQVR